MNTQPIAKTTRDTTLTVHSMFNTLQGEGPFAGRAATFLRLYGCNLQCPLCDTDYTSHAKLISPAEVTAELITMAMTTVPTGWKRHLVVITGGEPFRQPVALCDLLVCLAYTHNFVVQIETNGTLPPPTLPHVAGLPFSYATLQQAHNAFAQLDHADHTPLMPVFVVVSPKTGKVHYSTEKIAAAYKYVIDSTAQGTDDMLPRQALRHSAHPFIARPPARLAHSVYVQPCDPALDTTVFAAERQRVQQTNEVLAVTAAQTHGYIFQRQLHKELGLP